MDPKPSPINEIPITSGFGIFHNKYVTGNIEIVLAISKSG